MPNLTNYNIVRSVQEMVSHVNADMDLVYFTKYHEKLGHLYKFIDSTGKEFYSANYITNNTPTESGVVKFENDKEIAFSNYGRKLSQPVYSGFEEHSNERSPNSPGSKSRKRSPGSKSRKEIPGLKSRKESPGSKSRKGSPGSRKRFNGGRRKLGRKTRSKE
jgi:hypothetical protein